MAIKNYGEYCVSCKKNFGLLAVPTKCESCGTLVHFNCLGSHYLVKQLEKLNFNKARICRICRKEHSSTIRKEPDLKKLIKAYEKGYSKGYDDGYDAGYSDGDSG